ncbi:MAG: hypothetical protein ACEQSR_11495 [Candidatus Methylacidiphilales bacterium]
MNINLNFFNKKNVIILILIIIGYLLLISMNNYFFPRKSYQDYEKEEKEVTYMLEIKGRVKYVHTEKSHTYVELYNDSLTYSLPYTRSLKYSPNTLSYFLKIGDSIYKPKFDYSIVIVRNGEKTNWILGKDER